MANGLALQTPKPDYRHKKLPFRPGKIKAWTAQSIVKSTSSWIRMGKGNKPLLNGTRNHSGQLSGENWDTRGHSNMETTQCYGHPVNTGLPSAKAKPTTPGGSGKHLPKYKGRSQRGLQPLPLCTPMWGHTNKHDHQSTELLMAPHTIQGPEDNTRERKKILGKCTGQTAPRTQ